MFFCFFFLMENRVTEDPPSQLNGKFHKFFFFFFETTPNQSKSEKKIENIQKQPRNRIKKNLYVQKNLGQHENARHSSKFLYFEP